MRNKTRNFKNVIRWYFTIAFVFLISIVSGFVYWRYLDNSYEDSEELLRSSASLSMSVVDGDIHRKIGVTEGERSASYIEVKRELQEVLESSDLFVSVYTWRFNKDGDLVFIVDAQADAEDGSALGDIYEAEIGILTAYEGDDVVIEDGFSTDSWGTTRSAYAPIFTSNGDLDGFVGIDLGYDEYARENLEFLTLLGLILISSGIVSYFLSGVIVRNVYRPFELFISDIERSVKSDFKYEMDSSGYTLLEDITNAFNKAAKKARLNSEEIKSTVEERTSELEKLTSYMVDREIKMRELKKELSELKKKSHV